MFNLKWTLVLILVSLIEWLYLGVNLEDDTRTWRLSVCRSFQLNRYRAVWWYRSTIIIVVLFTNYADLFVTFFLVHKLKHLSLTVLMRHLLHLTFATFLWFHVGIIWLRFNLRYNTLAKGSLPKSVLLMVAPRFAFQKGRDMKICTFKSHLNISCTASLIIDTILLRVAFSY